MSLPLHLEAVSGASVETIAIKIILYLYKWKQCAMPILIISFSKLHVNAMRFN
uniref:Uncharacterized protein n=1 Tax=Arundo donax TaxID=35708 RepID=A0A0A9FXC4_ARUDO